MLDPTSNEYKGSFAFDTTKIGSVLKNPESEFLISTKKSGFSTELREDSKILAVSKNQVESKAAPISINIKNL